MATAAESKRVLDGGQATAAGLLYWSL